MHQAIHVKCTQDQPIHLLIDKLSSKSSDLYIFWQNYNQMYLQINEKNIEIARLRQEIDNLRRDKATVRVPPPKAEDGFLKERYLHLEKSVEDYKSEVDRLRRDCENLKRQNSRYHEENIQLQTLLQQLRDENSVQRNSIEKILIQLKAAQHEINNTGRVYEEAAQKDQLLNKYMERERELMGQVEELQIELDEIEIQSRQSKVYYEKLIKESMHNAKVKVLESLPSLIETSKHKVQVVAH